MLRLLRYLREQIRLVPHDEIRQLLGAKQSQQFLIADLHSLCGVHHQNGHIRTVELLFCLSNTKLAEAALIVKARRIHNHHRADRKQLHCLSNRVGGRAACL